MNRVPRITSVIPLSGYILDVTFENGEKRKFSVDPYIKEFPAFKPIVNYALFNTVHVDAGGYAIAWNDDIDIDRYDIWEDAVPDNMK